MKLRHAPFSLYATGTKPKHYTKQRFFRRYVDLVWGVEAYFYVGLGRFVARPSSRHRCRPGLSEHQRRRDGGEPLSLYDKPLERKNITGVGGSMEGLEYRLTRYQVRIFTIFCPVVGRVIYAGNFAREGVICADQPDVRKSALVWTLTARLRNIWLRSATDE